MIIKLLIVLFTILLVYQLFFDTTQEEFRIRNNLNSQGNSNTVNTGNMPLDNHDAIVNIRAELENKYKPLIVNIKGEPTNLLSRLAALEGDVQALSTNAMNQQQNKVESVPEPPDFSNE